jgi:hypothetical protein
VAWYYLRVIGIMYLRQPIKPYDKVNDWPALLGLLGVYSIDGGVIFRAWLVVEAYRKRFRDDSMIGWN